MVDGGAGTEQSRPGRGEIAALFGIIVLHLALVLWNLRNFPLTHDEWAYARRFADPFPEFFAWIRGDNHPPLFLVSLRAWTSLVGLNEVTMRMPGLLFGPLAIAVSWWGSRRLHGCRFALVYTALFALSPFIVFLGMAGKYYTTLMCAICIPVWICAVVLGEARQRLSQGMGICWFIACLLLPWIHYYGLVVESVLAAMLLYAWLRRGIPAARTLLILLAVAALVYTVWLPNLLVRVGQAGVDEPTALDPGMLRKTIVRGGYAVYAFLLGPSLAVTHFLLVGMGLLSGGALVLAGIIAILRSGWKTPLAYVDVSILALATSLFVLCLSVFMIILPFFPDLALPERIAFIAPMLYFVMVRGLFALPTTARWTALCLYTPPLLLSLFNAVAIRENNAWDYLIPWHEMADVVEAAKENGGPTAVVVVANLFDAGAWVYFRPRADEYLRFDPTEAFASPEEFVAELPDQFRTIVLFRPTRDTANGDATGVENALTEEFGEPESVQEYVHDSEAMLNLKKRFRRGTDVPTRSSKVLLIEYRR